MSIFDVLSMVGGLCLFLFGMETMGDGLTRTSGSRLESILASLTSSVPRGIALGCMVTAVIQSSSATTVMLVGFVNSGIMKLRQAIPVIMGANIGTTATAWILSLASMDGNSVFVKLLKPMSFSPVLAAIAIVFIMFSKNEKKHNIGLTLIGFAVLMYGMNIMSTAVSPLKDVPEFVNILTMFQNPILGVTAGAVITATIQSSSASVGILQALCMTGTITYGTAIPIIMGQNIGTCATAILSSIGANKGAKRVAAVHLSFNIIGTVVLLAVFYIANGFVGFEFIKDVANPADIALIHSVFNIAATVILIPFSKQLEKLAVVFVKDTPEKKIPDETLLLLDERFLEAPSFATAKCLEVSHKMASHSKECIFEALRLIDDYSQERIDHVNALEEKIDRYEDALGEYIVRLEKQDLNSDDNNTLSMILHNIGDFERISDHAKNIGEVASELHRKNLKFSPEASEEVGVFVDAVKEAVELAIDSFASGDVENSQRVEPLEEVIDGINDQVKRRHIQRLQKGKCTIELGFILSDLATNLERVADHCSNIAACTIESGKDKFGLHKYVQGIKKYDMGDFAEKEHYYKEKYSLPAN